LGGFLQSGPEVARENRSRRNLHGNEKEGKKEETLTVCETILARAENLSSLSGEAPLERRFLLWQLAFSIQQLNI
jgi:hypothetical protein